MKVFIVLALVSMAVANPLVQPVVLPEAPMPTVEDMQDAPMPEPIFIKPVFKDVAEAMEQAEMPSNAEEIFEALRALTRLTNFGIFALDRTPADVVQVVDIVEFQEDGAEELVAPADQEVLSEGVKVVEFAETLEQDLDTAENDAGVVIAAPAFEEIPAEPVKIVDFAPADDFPVEPVKIVEVAENVPQVFDDYNVGAEEVAAPAAEEIAAEAVKVVDVAQNIQNGPTDEDIQAIVRATINLLPPRYPSKFENPTWR